VAGSGARALLVAGTDSAARRRAEGPDAENAEDFEASGGLGFRRLIMRPGWLLFVALLALTLLASRGLIGHGWLQGAALLPPPVGASDLWHTYLQAWHPVSIGDEVATPAYLAVLALVSVPFLGSPSLLVTVLLIGGIPIAGLSAYLAMRRLALPLPYRLHASCSSLVL